MGLGHLGAIGAADFTLIGARANTQNGARARIGWVFGKIFAGVGSKHSRADEPTHDRKPRTREPKCDPTPRKLPNCCTCEGNCRPTHKERAPPRRAKARQQEDAKAYGQDEEGADQNGPGLAP